jgi:1-acyl-sn-glycerol-3-phosphate acyltransferase
VNGTWTREDEPDPVRIGPLGWIRAILRGSLMISVLLLGLALLLLVRLIERPIWGLKRPITPYITQLVCRISLFIMGLRLIIYGDRMQQNGAIVANHASWIDIFTINAAKRIYFVAKSEVAGWPLIGWLSRATGTVFIARRMQDAKIHRDVFEKRLQAGHQLMFFPEGTSTDGLQVLSFKPTLFEAFFAQNLRENLYIQPVTVKYSAPDGQKPRFYGWWGDMALGPHLLKSLAQRKHGLAQIIYHTPVAVADFAGRKELAKYCEDVVRAGMFGSTD